MGHSCFYMVTLVVVHLGWVDLDMGSSHGCLAAIVATYCPSRMVEHPKYKSTQPRCMTTSVTLYIFYILVKALRQSNVSYIELPLMEEVGLLLEYAGVDGGLDHGGGGDGRRLPIGRHVALHTVLLLFRQTKF